MSVSAIGSSNGASLFQADENSASNKTSSENSEAGATASKPKETTGSPQPSAQVTLSSTAQALATLAAAGITVSVGGAPIDAASLAGVNLPARSAGESMDHYELSIFSALSSALASSGLSIAITNPGGISMSMAPIPGKGLPTTGALVRPQNGHVVPPTSGNRYDGEISQSDFNDVLSQFGASKSESDQLFAALDTDQSGTLSNSELLQAIGSLGSSTPNASAEKLLTLLAPAGQSTVSAGELLSFESTLVAAEKPAS